MIHHGSFTDTNEYQSEQTLNSIVEACHRSIDWSVNLYFKTLKKSTPLFVDKVLRDKKNNFYRSFAAAFINETEMAQLVKDIEDHINQDVIALQNKWLPTIKFSNLRLPSLEPVNEEVNEQKMTLKLSQHVDKTVCQLTTKNLSKLAPSFIPKPFVSQANCSLAKKISRSVGVDTDSYYRDAKELIQNQIGGLLGNMEQDLKNKLKFQLSEQLYHWFDQYMLEPPETEQVVVNQ
ncbi:MAG: hypothetical protein ACOY35_01515 [Bacillota bacterium]|nr:hypothetical protein [Bacillota bacterium]